MRVFLLIVFGVIGALFLLRGLELILFTHELGGAVLQLGVGVLFAALFIRKWKSR